MQRAAVLADDHQLVGEGVAALLRASGWQVQLVHDGEAAMCECRTLKYQVAIVDVAMPRMDGFELLHAVRAERIDIPFVFLSMHSDPIVIRRAMENGALGYVSKSMALEDLVDALDLVCRGKRYVSESLANVSRPVPAERLTARELQVVKMLQEGMRCKAIAEQLGVSVRTVECHKFSAMQKRGAQSVVALIEMLRRPGLTSQY